MVLEQVLSGPDVAVIGHRGASGLVPENTVEAFRRASDLGCHMVELDVRRTRDGQLAVHHDATLADGRALHEVDAASLPDGVVLLDEAFEACGSMAVNVELKDYGGEPDHDVEASLARETLDFLAELDVLDRVLLSSFWLPTLHLVRSWPAAPPTGALLLSVGVAERTVADAVAAGHRAIHPHKDQVTPELVEAARAQNLAVLAWTVNDEDEMRRLAEWGVTGIMTDFPDRLARVLS